MDTEKQREIVARILLEDYKKGAKGINSIYIRNTYFIVMVATRLFENKKYFASLGLEYTKRLERNHTATYYLRPLGQSEDKAQASPINIEPAIQPQRELQAWEKQYEQYQGKDGRMYWREL